MIAKVKLVIRSGKKNADGKYTIYLRTTKDRKSSFISTGVSVEEGQWNGHQVVKHPNAIRLNKQLDKIKNDAIDRALEAEGKGVAASDIKDKLTRPTGKDFFEFAKEFVKEYDPEKYTRKKFDIALADLKEYLGREVLPFSSFDYSLLSKFKNHLAKRGNIDSTIETKFAKLRTIYLEAVEVHPDLFAGVRNPFRSFTFKKSPKKKTKLTRDEVKLLREGKVSGAAELAQDAFLLAFNFMGMRIGDVITIKVGQRKGKYFNYQMRKSGDSMRIEMTEEAIRIWDRYAEGKKPNDYLFPMLDKYRNKNAPFYKKLDSATAIINNGLKRLCEKVGIEKHVTTHVNRHTWNQLAREAGIPVAVRMEALGHEYEEATRNYDAALDDEIVNAANKLVVE